MKTFIEKYWIIGIYSWKFLILTKGDFWIRVKMYEYDLATKNYAITFYINHNLWMSQRTSTNICYNMCCYNEHLIQRTLKTWGEYYSQRTFDTTNIENMRGILFSTNIWYNENWKHEGNTIPLKKWHCRDMYLRTRGLKN